jgi:hypothetical protein
VLEQIVDYRPDVKERRNPRQNKRKPAESGGKSPDLRENEPDSDDQAVEWATELDGTAIYPASVHAYVDTLVFVLPREGLSKHDHEWLKQRCDLGIRRSKSWRRENELWLYYPIKPEVLDFLLRLTRRNPEVRHRQTHVALDLCFNSEKEKEQARRIFETYNTSPFCRTIPYREKHGTTYSKKKGNPNNRATYDYKECRVTGEPYCLHIEARMKGSRMLERNGVDIENIIALDEHTFWQKQLKMSKVDAQRLGRVYDNQAKKQARRKPNVYRRELSSGREFVYDRDRATGNLFKRAYRSTQTLVIKLRERGINVRGLFSAIEVSQMLPLGGVELNTELQDIYIR